MQGVQPSPRIYSVMHNPVHVLIKYFKRKWTAAGDLDPSGASVFVDDTAVKTDCPDVVPVMCHQVVAAGTGNGSRPAVDKPAGADKTFQNSSSGYEVRNVYHDR